MVWVVWCILYDGMSILITMKWQGEMTLNMPCDNQVIEQHIKKLLCLTTWEDPSLECFQHFIFEQARNKVRSKVSIHKMYTDVLLSTFTASKLAHVCFGKCLLNCYILKITRTPRYIGKEHLVKIETVTGPSCFFIGSPYQLKQILQIKSQGDGFWTQTPAGQRWNSLCGKKQP